MDEFKWNPIRTREMTAEEHEIFDGQVRRDWMYECKMPNFGNRVLVTDKSGLVTVAYYELDGLVDNFDEPYGRYGVAAWMPLPEGYVESTVAKEICNK